MVKLFERVSPEYFTGHESRPFGKVKDYVVEDHRLMKPLILK